MKFTALLGVLWKRLADRREPATTPGGRRMGRVTWTVDLDLWSPIVPNHLQNPNAWWCEIQPVTGLTVVAYAGDGADALARATAEYVRQNGGA